MSALKASLSAAARSRMESLEAEIARLKAELEKARRSPDGVVAAYVHADLLTRAETAEARAETAEAAAGAMREALEPFVGDVQVKALHVSILKASTDMTPVTITVTKRQFMEARKLRDAFPTIGAEVMRVVRAARSLDAELVTRHEGGGHGVYSEPHWHCQHCLEGWITNREDPSGHTNNCKAGELSNALAALGGSHER